jgi:hypothetical protein
VPSTPGYAETLWLRRASQINDRQVLPTRMVKITERVLSSRFTTVEIEHTPKAFAATHSTVPKVHSCGGRRKQQYISFALVITFPQIQSGR